MDTFEADGDMSARQETFRQGKAKKIYRKPELNRLEPQAALEKLRSLAVAGDKQAQECIRAILAKHGLGGDSP